MLHTTAQGQRLPAFPGAEGAGRYTSGGRGTEAVPTTVFEVTTLADDGSPGTLRAAIDVPAAARTVVFRVAGTIHLTKALRISWKNTTVAGQTAPGEGICVADYPVTISADNIIIRYLRFRLGDRNQNIGKVVDSGSDDALGAMNHSRLIIDHCSVSWSEDEAMSVYGAKADSLSVQWNLIAEPLNYSYHFEEGDKDFEHHGYGGIWGGKHASFHHNLFAHCDNRTPRWDGTRHGTPVGSENCDFRNNVIYNWGANNVYGGEGGNYNIVNNYYRPGPSTRAPNQLLNPYKRPGGSALPYGKFYLRGNVLEGRPATTAHNWAGVVMQDGTAADTVKAQAPIPFLIMPLPVETAAAAYAAVLADAGCTRPGRDALDRRLIDDVKRSKGRFIDVQGGYPHGTAYEVSKAAWPELAPGEAPKDQDHDGMPDAWEKAHGLNPRNPADRAARPRASYTNLELYLNERAEAAAK